MNQSGIALLAALGIFLVGPIIANSLHVHRRHATRIKKPTTVEHLLKHASLVLMSGPAEKIRQAVVALQLDGSARLTPGMLEAIRQKIHDIGDSDELSIIDVLASRTGNPVEEALMYIERLMC